MNQNQPQQMSVPTVDNHHMFKPCMMTIFMHDYAIRYELNKWSGLFRSEKRQRVQSVQIFNNVTLELVRGLSDEQIGKIVREVLTKLDQSKKQIEDGTVHTG